MNTRHERYLVPETPFAVEVIADAATGKYHWMITHGPEAEAFPPIIESVYPSDTFVQAWDTAHYCLSYSLRRWLRALNVHRQSHLLAKRGPLSQLFRRVGEAILDITE
jgi:hypothetical protein